MRHIRYDKIVLKELLLLNVRLIKGTNTIDTPQEIISTIYIDLFDISKQIHTCTSCFHIK